MAKFTLDVINEYPCVVYGINATINDYRLCWSINTVLGVSMKLKEPLSAFSKVNEGSIHNHFIFFDEVLQFTYHLIENRRGNNLFLPEVDKADYLLIIDGADGTEEEVEILNILKGIRSILMTFRVDVDKLKHKQNLLYIG